MSVFQCSVCTRWWLPFICTLAWSSSIWNECQKEKSVHGSPFLFLTDIYTWGGFHRPLCRSLAQNNLLCSGCLWRAAAEPWSIHLEGLACRKGSEQVPACGTWGSSSLVVQTFWCRTEREERRTSWLMFEKLFSIDGKSKIVCMRHWELLMKNLGLTLHPAFLFLTDNLALAFWPLWVLGSIHLTGSYSVVVLSLVPGQKVPIILAGVEGRKAECTLTFPEYSSAMLFQVVVLKSGCALKTCTVLKPQFNCWLQMLLLIQAKLLSQAEVLTDKSSWNSKEEEISIKIAFVENLKQNVHFSVKAFAS